MKVGKKSVANLIYAFQCHESVWKIWLEDVDEEGGICDEEESVRELVDGGGDNEDEIEPCRSEMSVPERSHAGSIESFEIESKGKEELGYVEGLVAVSSHTPMDSHYLSFLQWLPLEMVAETLDLVTFRQDL